MQVLKHALVIIHVFTFVTFMSDLVFQYFAFGLQVSKADFDKLFFALTEVSKTTSIYPIVTQCIERGYVYRVLNIYRKAY